jgi:uncharacterized membrane-anchored protein YhcB (DUF1043 family)
VDQVPFGTDSFAENPEPRVPCVLLADVSSSMAGQRLSSLNQGYIQQFQNTFSLLDKMHRDYQALDVQMAEEQSQLAGGAMARQRDEYLRHQLIRTRIARTL